MNYFDEENNIDFPIFEFTGYVRDPLDELFDSFDLDPLLVNLDESSYQERAKKEILSVEVLDVEKYIKTNELEEITNPTFFSSHGNPTSNGLLSNEIFGITQKDRQETFAYIDLHEYFIDPSCYKTLLKLDKRYADIVNGTKRFIINKEGDLEESDEGNTGIRWLKANFGKIKIKRSDARSRDVKIKYIEHNYKEGRMFISKYIVIPPYYRDVNTTSGKNTGVGQINTFYVNLLTAAKAIQDNNDYGLSMADTTCARIQNTLRNIYDWFCGNSNDSIQDAGTGLRGKFGLIKSNLQYTSDYGSRLVISAPELKRETIDDLMVSLDKSAMPLAAVAADFYPFMLFHMRKFFENEFLNVSSYEVIDKQGNIKYKELENALTVFTDDVLKDQLKKFAYSHDNRFIPIEVPIKHKDDESEEERKKTYWMTFKGKPFTPIEKVANNEIEEPMVYRKLTWVDVIYIAAVRSTEGKTISITRFPYDSYFNTIYTGIEVASTTETEPLVINGEYYRFYPKIREEDILQPSASKFVDIMQISNLYLDGMEADYDGDTIQVKGSFVNETNEELSKFTSSKANFIDLDCTNIRKSGKEAVQAMYNLTLVLSTDQDKLTNPEF